MIKKSIATLLLLSSLQAEQNIAMTTTEIRAFPLEPKQGYLDLAYERVNDTLDLFNVRQSQLGNAKNYGAIGDAVGYRIGAGYGLLPYLSLHYEFERLNVNYIDEKLKNSKHDLFMKVDLYRNPSAMIETYGIDFGYVRNSAADLAIRRESTLNSMFQKVKPGSSFRIENGVIYYGENASIEFLDTEPPHLLISDMKDDSFYIRFLAGTKIKRSVLNLFLGFKTTSIHSRINLKPDDPLLQAAIESFGDLDLARHEQSLFGGFTWNIEYNRWLLDLGYRYIRLFHRGSDLDETNDNHIIDAAVGYPLNDRTLLYVGGRLMLHQFNGVIPYLYNKYTQSKYDKKYGYARFGIVYNFDAKEWSTPASYVVGY